MSKPFSIGQRVQITKGSRKGQIGYVIEQTPIDEVNIAPNHSWGSPQWVTVASSYRVALDMGNVMIPTRYLTYFDDELIEA